MSAERGSTGLSGIIAVDKPVSLTSHDVVNRIRRLSGEKRVGHCGTLDPAATGLLLVCVGPATRLSDYLSAQRKSYVARISFGVATDTDDATGSIIKTCPVPSALAEADFARAHLAGKRGAQEQIPPQYSAIRRQGVRAYEAARRGQTPLLVPRKIEVYAADLLEVFEDDLVHWDVAFEVSKGTYIRSLARDLASGLDTCGHLSALRRTKSGSIGLEHAFSLEQIADAVSEGSISSCFINPIEALDLPTYELDEKQHGLVVNGCHLSALNSTTDQMMHAANLVACTWQNELLALYRFDALHEDWRAHVVIPGGVKEGMYVRR